MNRHAVWSIVLVAALAACSKTTPKEGEEVASTSAKESAKSALVETFALGSIAWTIDESGKIRAEVRDKDGANTSKSANGTAEWEGGSAKLTYDDSAKALVGNGLALKEDITPVKYTITGGPEPMSGTLQVPVGGTPALVVDTKADAKPEPPEGSGPNGGVVQTVGEDRVEIVADDDSDEVRVYILDTDGKPVSPGDRKVTLALNGDSNDVIVVTPSSDGLYLVGTWKTKTDPSRITVSVRRGAKVHVAIVGWRPGTKLVVAGAPKWKVHKPKGWKKIKDKDKDKDDDDDRGHGPGRGHGHDNGKHKGKK